MAPEQSMKEWIESQGTERLKRIRVHMHGSVLSPDDKDVLKRLDSKNKAYTTRSGIPSAKLVGLTELARDWSEAQIHAYILSEIVPSPILLRFGGVQGLHGLDEEHRTEWVWCQKMLEERPKPDFIIGPSKASFQDHEFALLQRYASKSNSAFPTDQICFPLVVCEVESPLNGLANAEVRNCHSAAIAVRSLFVLYESAYGKDSTQAKADLDQRLLVFSVAYNNSDVKLYGHYAIGTDDATREYHRFEIFTTSLASMSEWRHDTYGFMLNIYEKFAPGHIKRIKDAVAHLDPTTFPARTLWQEAAEAASRETDDNEPVL